MNVASGPGIGQSIPKLGLLDHPEGKLGSYLSGGFLHA